MNRVVSWAYSEAIEEAMRLIEPPIMARLQHVHFLCGVSPEYVGLHHLGLVAGVYGAQDVDYNTRAHVSWGDVCEDAERRTTVVLPLPEDAHPAVIVHELGHCLDEVLGFKHSAVPVNEYAQMHRMEAFAEAFKAQYFYLGDEAERIFQSDIATRRMFDRLARNEN